MSQAGTSKQEPPNEGGEPAPPRSEQFTQYARKAADPARRAELFLQAAHLSEEAEDDPQRAAALYRQALEADPHLSAALIALERIYLRASNWRALYTIYAIHADALEVQRKGQARAEIYVKMARLARERLAEEELASVCYENLLSVQPGESEAIRFLLATHEHNQDWRAIERLLRAEAPRVSDSRDRAEMLRTLGDTLRFGAHQPAEAAGVYRDSYRTDPLNRGAFEGLVAVLREQGKTDELIALFEERQEHLERERGSEEKEAELFELRLALADLAAANPERWPLARRTLEAAASLRPQSAQVLRREAELAAREEDFERAARTYEALLSLVPKASPVRADLLITLAEICRVRLGDPGRALSLLEEAAVLLRSQPASPALEMAQRTLAELHLGRGELTQARTLYTVLLGRTPPEEKATFSEYALRLAEIHEREGEPGEALRHYEEVVEIFPRYAKALLGRARILYERSDHREALAAYYTYLEALPESSRNEERREATARIARLYQRGGDLERAEERYVELLRQDADDAQAHAGLARLYRESGRDDEAAEHWQWLRGHLSAEADLDGWSEASESLAWFFESRERPQEAVPLYEEVLEHLPGSILARARLAALCEAAGRWDEAQRHYAELLQVLPPGTPAEQRQEIERSLRRAERNAFFEGGM